MGVTARDGRAERAMFAALRRHPSPPPRPFRIVVTSTWRSTSLTFQEPSYDVVNVQFIGLSHRAGVSCASRASHGAPYYTDDRRSTKITGLRAARHGIALAASYELLAMAVRITAHSTPFRLASPLSSLRHSTSLFAALRHSALHPGPPRPYALARPLDFSNMRVTTPFLLGRVGNAKCSVFPAKAWFIRTITINLCCNRSSAIVGFRCFCL